MSQPLVECIPNFSEARRPEVVEAIRNAIASVPEVSILDQHSDMDHNRTVITFIGPPAAVEEAAFRGIEKAVQLIDLNYHTGEHPRIGAADVVPFVPIRDITMEECVEMARRLGKRVGETLQIPVYLYEEAATRPSRKNLEDIRRGEYEALKEEMGRNPERIPDFGPERVGPAGATVIGARQPLIAFNVYLTTNDVSIASQIARAVRHSSGGLRFVKAMGVLVEGRAQVSMNLTNFRQTPVHRVVEMIRREAQRYGVGIHHSELVGLIPEEALIDSAVWYLQLDGFEPNQVLERRMTQALSKETASPVLQSSFLDELARGTPTPGGGSASAYSAAAGAALVAMVARLTVGKKKYAEVESQMWAIIEQAEALRQEMTHAIEEDAQAFETYLTASRMPKDTPEQQEIRARALEEATLGAIQVPLRVARKAVEIMALAVQVATLGNLNAISDAGSALAQARAALTGAGLNVRINCLGLSDPSLVETFVSELRQLEEQAATFETQMRDILIQRGKLPF
ncbi:glutamate formimidoyltransferase [Anaerolinea thermophila]|uniref:glutamate formimidoyltransferase n=2 Tax=Anaerolinea TaxID=233189 RepID=UPI0026EF4852|nr:glutamate formimidoyltransferase [Anaerolinea thermophila]